MSPNPHQLPSPHPSTYIPPSSPLPQPSPEQSINPHSLSNLTTPLCTPPPLSPSISPQWSKTPESLSDLSSPEISSDESDDDFGIPIEWPPSRPMVNFAHDTELEEDYEIGWQWHEQDPGPLVTPYTRFRQCLLDPTKQKTSSMHCSVCKCTQLSPRKQTDMCNKRYKEVSSLQNIYLYQINVKLFSRTLRLYMWLAQTHSYWNNVSYL